MKVLDPGQRPAFCSACFQPPSVSDPQPEFVDFDAAWDGPVIDHESGIKVTIDDLVLCENCIAAAARLVGMEPAEEMRSRITELEAWNKELESANKDKDKAISHLEHTVSTVIDHPVKRPAGRPQLVGPGEKDGELKELRSRRKMAERVSQGKKRAAKEKVEA